MAEARAVQEGLRGKISLKGSPRSVKFIAGADISYRRFSSRAVAGVVVFSWPELEVVETRTVSGSMEFPYVPGYLSFREGPLLLRVFDEHKHLVIRPTRDAIYRPADASVATADRDNVHWFEAQSEVTFAFGVALTGLDADRRPGRVYLDARAATREAGDLLRVPIIGVRTAFRRYGRSH